MGRNIRYIAIVSLLLSVAGFSGKPVQHERWAIKTSYAEPTANPKIIAIGTLMHLKAPSKKLHFRCE